MRHRASRDGGGRRLTVLRRRLLAGSALCLCLLAGGGDAAAMTLTEALAAAYTSNPTLQAQRARLRETDEGVPQALSGWRPTVTFTGSTGVSRFESNAPITTLTPTSSQNVGSGQQVTLSPNTLDLSVTQPIYRGGRTAAATSQAENFVRAARATTLLTEQQVLFQVATSFMDVVQNQAVLDLNINNEQVLRRQLEATRDRFRVGEVTRTDVSQAEASLATATASRVQSEGNLENVRAVFQRFVGVAPGLLTAPTERPVLPVSRAEVATLAANNNPNVISAQFNEAAARDNVRVVRGQLLPQISIVGDANRSQETTIRDRTLNNFSIIARMTVPLYEGGLVYSQTRQAAETVGERRSQVDDARRQAIATAQSDWETLQSNQARVRSLQASVRANAIAYEGTQQEALVGARTVLDVLVAEQTLFSSRVQLVQAQHDEFVAEFAVTQDIGRLNALDLKLPVKAYDFDKHYRDVRGKWIGLSPSD
jgi:outer membrane protein